jgi:hypothetical protein
MSRHTLLLLIACAAALSSTGCTEYGSVEQGRVIGYNKQSGQITLIRDSTGGNPGKAVYDTLPPLAVRSPEDPDEMGPAPQAGKLMLVDRKKQELLVYDAATSQFRSFPYTPVAERHNVAKATGLPLIDAAKQTITVYCREDKVALTVSATPEMLAMPAETWKTGDEIRYYFKDPARALRMMNLTRTDLTKS